MNKKSSRLWLGILVYSFLVFAAVSLIMLNQCSYLITPIQGTVNKYV